MNTVSKEARIKPLHLVARIAVVVALVIIQGLVYSALREPLFQPQERAFLQRSLYAQHTWTNAPLDMFHFFTVFLPLLVVVGGYVLYVRQLEPRWFGLRRNTPRT